MPHIRLNLSAVLPDFGVSSVGPASIKVSIVVDRCRLSSGDARRCCWSVINVFVLEWVSHLKCETGIEGLTFSRGFWQ